MDRRTAIRRCWIFTLFTLAAALAAVFLPHKLSTDLFDLLPKGHPAIDSARAVAQKFGGADQELISISWPAGDDDARQAASALVDELAPRLRADPEIAEVVGDLHQSQAMLKGLGPIYLDLLPADRLEDFNRRLSPEGMKAALAGGKSLMSSPTGLMAGEFFRQDPLGLVGMVLEKQTPPGKTHGDLLSGLLLAPDDHHALLLARGKRPVAEMTAAHALLAAVDRAIAGARIAAQITADDEIEVGHSGGYAIAARDEALIRHDATVGSLLTTVLVISLIGFVTRSFRVPHLVMAPLLAATVWLAALIFLSPWKIGASAAGSCGILMGLGSDLAIVLYARVVAGMQDGLAPGAAAAQASRQGRGALWLCAATTAATFGALALTRFPILQQLGLIVAAGILLAALAIHFWLPALLLVFMPAGGFPPLRDLGVGRFTRWLRPEGAGSRTRLFTAWAVGLILSGVFCGFAWKRADFDLSAMHRASNPEVGKFEGLLDLYGLPRESQIVMLQANSVQELIEQCSELDKHGLIQSSTGFCHWIPSQSVREFWQKNRAAGAYEEHEIPNSSGREQMILAEQFKLALANAGYRPDSFSSAIEFIRSVKFQGSGLSESTISSQPILKEWFRGPARDDPRFFAQMVIPEDKLVSSESLPKGARLMSMPLTNRALAEMGRRDIVIAFFAGIGLLILLHAIGLRNRMHEIWVLALYAASLGILLLPLALGWLKIDILALAGMLVLAGVVTDYGIQWLGAFSPTAGEGSANLRAMVGNALALDALTTLVAFLALLTAEYAGMRSLGWVAGAGSLLGCIFALMGTWTAPKSNPEVT